MKWHIGIQQHLTQISYLVIPIKIAACFTSVPSASKLMCIVLLNKEALAYYQK